MTSRAQLHDTVVPFTAGDGRKLNLVHVEGERPATRGPVLLVHGAGVRADIFRAPVPTTIVDALVTKGYDVWLENWRASIDVEASSWTLDQAAVYDHPYAVRTIMERSGASDLQAVVHCQGSTSFAMSAAAGLVPEVRTIVTNAVSLHPVLPAWSVVKIRAVAPWLGRLTPYLDPSWGLHADTALAKAITAFVRLFHRECDNTVCRMVSFTYGAGFPALWSHANLNEATHDWLRHEFARVPFSFFGQMARSVRHGAMVSMGHPSLPERFDDGPPQTDARFVFLAGADNHCFLAESQERSFAFLDRHRPGHHALHVVPGYGHLDMFMGRNAGRDVFPLILDELEHGS